MVSQNGLCVVSDEIQRVVRFHLHIDITSVASKTWHEAGAQQILQMTFEKQFYHQIKISGRRGGKERILRVLLLLTHSRLFLSDTSCCKSTVFNRKRSDLLHVSRRHLRFHTPNVFLLLLLPPSPSTFSIVHLCPWLSSLPLLSSVLPRSIVLSRDIKQSPTFTPFIRATLNYHIGSSTQHSCRSLCIRPPVTHFSFLGGPSWTTYLILTYPRPTQRTANAGFQDSTTCRIIH